MSLLHSVQHALLDTMIGSIKAPRKLLLVDHGTMRIMSAACRLYDVMKQGVTVVENVAIKRQPLPFDAIYFLTPDEESIQYLLDDFDESSDRKKKPQYPVVHLFFSSRLSDKLLSVIQGHRVVKRIQTLKELNVDFLAFESQAFDLDSPNSFKLLFSPDGDPEIEEAKIAKRLVSLCLALGEHPVVRYGRTPTASRLANTFQEALEDIPASYTKNLKPPGKGFTLLILDRSFDPMSPLLHEFTYQAMIYDLMEIEDNCYKYKFNSDGQQKERKSLLDEHDFLWPKLRHMHIADSISWIIESFNDFIRTNKISNLKSTEKGVKGLRAINKAMKEMPQYQEMFSKYALHITLASECMKMVEVKELLKIAKLEQNLATGSEANGKKTNKGTVTTDVHAIVSDDSLPKEEKLRLFLIYLISLQDQIKQKDRQKMMQAAEFNKKEKEAIENAQYVGVSLDKKDANAKYKKNNDKKKDKKKPAADDVPYEVSRWAPVLKQIITELLDDELSVDDFPYSGKKIAFRSDNEGGKKKAISLKRKGAEKKRATWGDDKKGKGKIDHEGSSSGSGGKLVVFIAGGVAYSEIRTAYEIDSAEVIIGSTSVLTPSLFVDGLKDLNKGELHSDATTDASD